MLSPEDDRESSGVAEGDVVEEIRGDLLDLQQAIGCEGKGELTGGACKQDCKLTCCPVNG